MKEHIKPLPLGTEKKRSAVSDRPRVKRTKPSKQQTHTIQSTVPSVQLDVKPCVKLEELLSTPIKQERAQSEPKINPFIKEEFLPDKTPPLPPLPSLSSPPTISLPSPPPSLVLLPVPSPPPLIPLPSPPQSIPEPDCREENESIETNLNAIKLKPCRTVLNDLLEDMKQDVPIKEEPVRLTADEIRKAEEGQAAAAMLLEQMSDVEEKYNPPLTPSPQASPPSSPKPVPLPPSDNILDSKFSPPNYSIKREFHPEDMLTSTVQSINTE